MSAQSLTLRRTSAGLELRVAYAFEDKRPTPRAAKGMAKGLLEEALERLERGAVDGGFRENAVQRSGVTHLVMEDAS